VRAVALVLAAALACCGRPETGYPPAYELNFMRACEAQSTRALCACIWEKIEADVAAADFAALERLPAAERETHPLKLQIDDYALSCARDLAADGASAPQP
jgi:hypothetical protein